MYFALLDFLRFFAAFSVMVHHYFASSFGLDTGIVGYYLHYGYLGVHLFFIISGFVIYFSVQRPLAEYALGRFLRLYPLFWVSCTVTYVVTLLLDSHHLSFSYYLINMTGLNSQVFAHLVDGVYWTLTKEIQFYVMIGAFVWFFSRRRLEWFFMGWLVLSAASIWYGGGNTLIAKLLVAVYAPYFAFGGLFALAYNKWKDVSLGVRSLYVTLLVIAGATPFYISHRLALLGITDFYVVFDRPTSIIIGSFFVVVPLLIIVSTHVRSRWVVRWAKIAGGITYPLYLLHQKIGALIINHMAAHGQVIAVSFVVAGAMIGISYVVYVHEERWRKQLFKNVLHKIALSRATSPVASDAP